MGNRLWRELQPRQSCTSMCPGSSLRGQRVAGKDLVPEKRSCLWLFVSYCANNVSVSLYSFK